MVKALEPDIIGLVDALLDDVEAGGTFDVIADLAYPLPVAVICRLLGVPIEDEPQFSRASALLAQGAGPVHHLHRRRRPEFRANGCRRTVVARHTCAT